MSTTTTAVEIKLAAQPWKGEHYESRGLLLLGESFYSYPEGGELNVPAGERICIDQVEWVLDNFEACVSGPQRTPFIVKLSRALTGEYAPDKSALQAAWSTVLFTDFVDDSVGEKGSKPSEPQWLAAQTAFRPFLQKHKPRRALIMGTTTTWVWLPPSDVKLGHYTEGYRLLDGSLCVCRATAHPTGGYAPPGWRFYRDSIRELEALVPPE